MRQKGSFLFVRWDPEKKTAMNVCTPGTQKKKSGMVVSWVWLIVILIITLVLVLLYFRFIHYPLMYRLMSRETIISLDSGCKCTDIDFESYRNNIQEFLTHGGNFNELETDQDIIEKIFNSDDQNVVAKGSRTNANYPNMLKLSRIEIRRLRDRLSWRDRFEMYWYRIRCNAIANEFERRNIQSI